MMLEQQNVILKNIFKTLQAISNKQNVSNIQRTSVNLQNIIEQYNFLYKLKTVINRYIVQIIYHTYMYLDFKFMDTKKSITLL